MESSIKPMLRAEKSALAPALAELQKPGIEFGNNHSGYQYKKWVPALIPFIQASTGIWPLVQDGWNNNIEHLPFFQRINAGQKFDFQIILPRDHPFLLLDVKVIATAFNVTSDDPVTTSIGSRFRNPGFDLATQTALYKKYLMQGVENVETTLIAVSPGGKDIWGSLQNVTGLDNSVRTVGPVPHIERVPLSNSQSNRSGHGALQHHLLFPEEGIIRVTVENRNLDNGFAPPAPRDGIDVNGLIFGYVIQL